MAPNIECICVGCFGILICHAVKTVFKLPTNCLQRLCLVANIYRSITYLLFLPACFIVERLQEAYDELSKWIDMSDSKVRSDVFQKSSHL